MVCGAPLSHSPLAPQTIGVVFSYMLFLGSTKLAVRFDCALLERSGQYLEDVSDAGSGNSLAQSLNGEQPARQKINWLTWASQMLVWCFITVLARSLVLITMLLFKNLALEDLSAWIAQSWSCSPADLLTLVMIACPVVMNIGMLIVSGAWILLHQET